MGLDAASPPDGVLVRGLAADGAVRLLLADVQGPAEHARVRHGLDPHAAKITAEVMAAAALLAAHIKGDEMITLQLQGETPRCAVHVDFTAEGQVRARTTPDVIPPFARMKGVLHALKSLGEREVYRGISEVDGTVEHAMALHLGNSAQVDAVLRLGVAVEHGEVRRAHGLLVERLPEEPGLPSMSAAEFTDRYAALREADLGQIVGGLAFGTLEGERVSILERRALPWKCRCNRDKVAAMLQALGAEEIRAMLERDAGGTITCHFCNEVYLFDADQLTALL